MTKSIETYSSLERKYAALDFDKQKVILGCDYYTNSSNKYQTVRVLLDEDGEYIVEGDIKWHLNNTDINFMKAMLPNLFPFFLTNLINPNISIVDSVIGLDGFFIEFQINGLAPIFRYLGASNEQPSIDFVSNLGNGELFRFNIPATGRKSIGFKYKDEYPAVNFFGCFESFVIDAVRNHPKVRLPLLYHSDM